MKPNEEAIVMFESDEAASLKTVTGWVSRHGRFYGNDERAARYDGATHRKCDGCAAVVVSNHMMLCDDCHRKSVAERFGRLPLESWNGEPLVLFEDDHYFWDSDDIAEYCEEFEIAVDDLLLVKCVPVYAEELDPHEIFADDLPEDGEVPAYVADAFAALNEVLRTKQHPLSWQAGNIRVALTTADLHKAVPSQEIA